MIFLEIFKKTHHTTLYKLFSAEGQAERGTDIMNRTSQFWYAVSNVLHIYRSLRNFWHFYRQWSRYHITVCQFNTATHAVNWLTKIIWFRSVPI